MRSFVDTNVLIYWADKTEAAKRAVARQLMRDAEPGAFVISTQVLQEFYTVSTRKLEQPLSEQDAASAVERFSEMPVVGSDPVFVKAAIQLSRDAQISLWDALIVHAAASSGCDRILTEDLQDGAVLAGVRIENPF